MCQKKLQVLIPETGQTRTTCPYHKGQILRVGTGCGQCGWPYSDGQISSSLILDVDDSEVSSEPTIYNQDQTHQHLVVQRPLPPRPSQVNYSPQEITQLTGYFQSIACSYQRTQEMEAYGFKVMDNH